LRKHDNFLETLKNDYVQNKRDVLDLLTMLILPGDVNKMSNLIDLIYRKLYLSFMDETLQGFESYKIFNKNLKEDGEDDCNFIKDCLFLVEDIEPLIKSLKEKGYSVNPNKNGQINSASSLLSCTDIDFRDALYNHNCLHEDRFFEGKFSYKNIHERLGRGIY
jgi:hypothetical protein